MTNYCFNMEIIGHRGSSAIAPENTLPAIEMAFKSGVQGAEFDLQLTKDKKVVVAHDDTLERVAANTFGLPEEVYKRVITTNIGDLTFEEIRAIDVGFWKGGAFKGVQVPTLREVLKGVPQGQVAMLDLKADSAIIPYVVEILKEIPCAVIAVSFGLQVIREFKALMPAIPCYYVRLYKQIADVPWDKLLKDAEQLDGVSLESGPIITEQLIRTIHERGQKIMAWVNLHPDPLDTQETVNEYAQMKVDYFITNQPELFAKS